MDSATTVALRAGNVAGRPVVLRDRRTHTRTRLVSRRPTPAAPDRTQSRRPPALRSPTSSAHAHAVELLHEGVPLPLIQRQLGHSHLSTTGTYLQGIDSEEIISTVHARRAPMMHASAGLTL